MKMKGKYSLVDGKRPHMPSNYYKFNFLNPTSKEEAIFFFFSSDKKAEVETSIKKT